ncbi:MAG: AAA family ATPase [Succinatimonas sp.]|nr:AAA family ATPase [Succinatimonas sp.]
MKRDLISKLIDWKDSNLRKPLILLGARQFGKTYLLKDFGKSNYQNTAYISFESNQEYLEIFKRDKNPNRIIKELSYLLKLKIEPQKTLIIFDDVQKAPDVICSLKYFCEDANEYHIACAATSLENSSLQHKVFPVGKVNFLDVYPLTFSEFLGAIGENFLQAYLHDYDTLEPVSTPTYNDLVDKLKLYLTIGGMPKALNAYLKDDDLGTVDDVLSGIINDYYLNFLQGPSIKPYPKIKAIFDSLPTQLSKENKKFLFNLVKVGARAREYEDALQWLVNARVFYKIYRNKAPKLPVSAYDDLSAFKMYLVDVGMLRRLSKLSAYAISEGNRLFSEFKGALTENFVLEQLVTQFEMPRYWSVLNPPHEVDFLIQKDNDIIPIEVKSDANIRSRSLQKYQELFKDDIKLRVRFSLENLKLDGNLLNIPLFMANEASRLIEMAYKQLGIK